MFTYLEFAVAWCSRKFISSETSLLVMPCLKLYIIFLQCSLTEEKRSVIWKKCLKAFIIFLSTLYAVTLKRHDAKQNMCE
jgi:hypothetical protein